MDFDCCDKVLNMSCVKELGIYSVGRVAGGGNNAIFKAQAKSGRFYAVKRYSSHESIINERLNREFTALSFLSKQGVDVVPSVYESDLINNIGVYDWIEGERVTKISRQHIGQLVVFLSQLKLLAGHDEAQRLLPAKDACMRATGLFKLIEDRFNRLNAIEDQYLDVEKFVFRDCAELYASLKNRAVKVYHEHGLGPDEALCSKYLTLSPSDYGFHNALETAGGKLKFIDFEYFGWDDPVKMVSDFLWHPGQQLSQSMRLYFKEKAEKIFVDEEYYGIRFDALFPLYGIVWVLILLNNFIPSIWRARVSYGIALDHNKTEILTKQYEKAKFMLSVICKSVKDLSFGI